MSSGSEAKIKQSLKHGTYKQTGHYNTKPTDCGSNQLYRGGGQTRSPRSHRDCYGDCKE